MAARDAHHEQVKAALIKDGWTITDDPYTISLENRNVFIDLGAERLVAAEKGKQKIALEIKVFSGPSDVLDFRNAVGQYVFYRSLLTRYEPERRLFLAISETVATGILAEPIAQPVLEDEAIAVVVFDPQKEEIVQWMT